MLTRGQLINYGLSFPDTYQDEPFHDPNWKLVRIKSTKKAFLWTYEKDNVLCMNLKVDPKWRDFWRKVYPSVLPGYHMNKDHWNTVIVDGSISDHELMRMIAEKCNLRTEKKLIAVGV